MTMTQQEKDALSQNWDQAKSQVQSKFPNVTEDELGDGSSVDQVSGAIAARTGQAPAEIEKSLKEIAKQFSS